MDARTDAHAEEMEGHLGKSRELKAYTVVVKYHEAQLECVLYIDRI